MSQQQEQLQSNDNTTTTYSSLRVNNLYLNSPEQPQIHSNNEATSKGVD